MGFSFTNIKNKRLIIDILIVLFLFHTIQFVLSFYNDKAFKIYFYITTIIYYLYNVYLIGSYEDNT